MADPVASPDPEREGTHPVLIVAGTVLAVVLLSFVIYAVGGSSDQDVFAAGQTADPANPGARGGCVFGPPDDSYSVAAAFDPDPPRPEGTTLRLTVRQGGRAVTGAKVCVIADMPTMEHPGLTGTGKELSGGRYETVIKFGMGGNWKASVVIAEPGKAVVSVPLSIEVAEVEQE
jgi:hypothetical protein